MKALLLSRPGDFGALEEAWSRSPLLLPILGKTLWERHGEFLKSSGIEEARLLVGSKNDSNDVDPEIVKFMETRPGGIDWSLRTWPMGAFPKGQSLIDCLRRQSIFLGSQEALVLSAPQLILEPLTGPKVPPGFPENPSRTLAPYLLRSDGILEPTRIGTTASLTSVRDFYSTIMKLLTTSIPAPTSLKRVHPTAQITPPIFIDPNVRVRAGAKIGPQVVLENGVSVGKRCSIERSIVFGNVEIGNGFEISEKIVMGTTILSPTWGGKASIEDERLLREKRIFSLGWFVSQLKMAIGRPTPIRFALPTVSKR